MTPAFLARSTPALDKIRGLRGDALRIGKAILAGAVFVQLALLSLPSAHAVDPLPPDLERASADAQTRYLEEIGRQMHEKKIQVGRQRHKERVRLRQAIHRHMVAEVALRQAQVRRASAHLVPESQMQTLLEIGGILLLGGVAIVVFIHLWRRTSARVSS